METGRIKRNIGRIKRNIGIEAVIELDKVTDVTFTNIDHSDYPDFCDAYIESAEYKGREMTEAEIEELQDEHDLWVRDKLEVAVFDDPV